MAAASSIRIKRGDTWRTEFAWAQPDGSPVDLTGCTARLQMRLKSDDSLALTASTATGELSIAPLTGVVSLTVGAEIMALVAPDSYEIDLELTFLDGTVMSTVTTSVTVLKDITRA